MAGIGKPGPVCAVATPNAAAAVRIVFANMLRGEMINWFDVFGMYRRLLFNSNSRLGKHGRFLLKSEPL